MVDNTNIMDNITNYSVKQYGAHNTSSSFTYLADGNAGTLADLLPTSIANEGDSNESIMWSIKQITYLPSAKAYAPSYIMAGLKFSRNVNERYCLVQYRYHNTHISGPYPAVFESGGVVYAYALLTYDATPLKSNEYFGRVEPVTGIREGTTDIYPVITDYNMSSGEYRNMQNTSFNDFYANIRTNDKFLLETKTYFEALNNTLIGNKDNLKVYTGNYYQRFDGYYNIGIDNTTNVRMMTLLKCAADIPVFDISNYSAIANYLLNGEIEESLSPSSWSAETQETEAGFKIPDYTTTWNIYLTAGDGNGRAVITALCPMAEELGAEPRKKVKTVYSVDPKTSYLFDSKYTYQEKQYGNVFGVNLSDIARNEGGSAWLDSNNDPKGNHTIYGMLYTGGGNSIAFSFEWFFEPTSNIGVEIVSGNAVKFWKTAVSPVGSFVIQSTSVEQTAWGWKYTDLYGDVVNLHINESYTEENDVYNPDRGNQYNPQTDTYGGSSGFIPQRGGAYYTYKLTYQELKNVVSQFTGVTWTSVLASIFGGDLWKCLKSLKYTPIAYNGAVTKSKLLLGGGTTQVGGADYDYINATYVTPCGTISNIARKYNNFLDYNPYTQFILHLPFTGYVDLPVDEIYNCTLKFELAVDYITGEGLWLISRNGCIRWTYTCNVAANIPLDGYSSAELAQSVMGHIGISGIASASLSTPVQIRDKQMKMETRSGYLNALDSMSIFYILEYPKAQLPTSAPHDVGRPCGLTKTLSSLKGFTKCKNVDVSGYSCTDAERNELISLLESGIYL